MSLWLLASIILVQIQTANPKQTNPNHPNSKPNRKQKQKKAWYQIPPLLCHSPSPSCFAICEPPWLLSSMETILSPRSLSPLFNPKPSCPKTLSSSSIQPRSSNSLFLTKSITCSLKKHQPQSLSSSLPTPTSWLSHAQKGLAALAITLALNFSPLLPSGNALASEFDVINEGPPKETYVVDDAGVLSRVTKSDLKRLLTDLESRKNFRINFVIVRKLTVSTVFVFFLP
jgi:hypothetical protein